MLHAGMRFLDKTKILCATMRWADVENLHAGRSFMGLLDEMEAYSWHWKFNHGVRICAELALAITFMFKLFRLFPYTSDTAAETLGFYIIGTFLFLGSVLVTIVVPAVVSDACFAAMEHRIDQVMYEEAELVTLDSALTAGSLLAKISLQMQLQRDGGRRGFYVAFGVLTTHRARLYGVSMLSICVSIAALVHYTDGEPA